MIHKNAHCRVYATRWVGFGLWGRCKSYSMYAKIACAFQQIWYHLHAKTAYYIHAKQVRITSTSKSIYAYQHKFYFYLV